MRLDRVAWCVAVLACAAPAVAGAQGFGLNEIGTCAVGRGQAVTAAPCGDPSSIYWNPAALTMLDGWTAYGGLAVIRVMGNFTADTSGREDIANVPWSYPPHLFVSYTSKDHKWAAGVGAYVPYGLTSQWKGDFPGRFLAEKASIASFYIQPNFSLQIAKDWSIGGGPVFGYSQVELRQALDLSQVPVPGLPVTFGLLGVPVGTEFGVAKLKGHGTAWGFNVGIHGTIQSNWQVGARYLSQLKFNYNNADATFAQTLTNLLVPTTVVLAPGDTLPAGTPLDAVLTTEFLPGAPLSAQHASTSIKHPAQAEVGLAYTGFTNTTLEADYVWINYTAFNKLPVNFNGPGEALLSRTLLEQYNNAWSIRVGAEHAFAAGFRGRAGFSFVHSPAPDITVTPLLPDQDRRNYNLGIGVPLSARWTLDAGYLHVDTSGRRGRIIERTEENPISNNPDAVNSGFYELNANIFSLSLKAHF